MKKLIAIATVGGFLAAGMTSVQGSDRGWATAGKVLTGLVVGAAIAQAFEPAPVVYHQTVYYAPPPVVVYDPPPRVHVAPGPVVVRPSPVRVHAAPVIVRPAPVVYAPPPVVYVQHSPVYLARPRPMASVSFGPRYRHHPVVYRVCH